VLPANDEDIQWGISVEGSICRMCKSSRSHALPRVLDNLALVCRICCTSAMAGYSFTNCHKYASFQVNNTMQVKILTGFLQICHFLKPNKARGFSDIFLV